MEYPGLIYALTLPPTWGGIIVISRY